jgi:hypothetical protein
MVVRCAGWLAILLGLGGPASGEGCRQALILALDVSGSVTISDDLLQRQGLARALLSPAVSDAFLRGDPVALQVFEWAGRSLQRTLLPDWHMIRSAEDLAEVARSIAVPSERGAERHRLRTALGAALDHALDLFEEGPDCRVRTLDVSGDGRNNEGPGVSEIYARRAWGNITVNALVIQGPTREWGISRYFERFVLRGPGAFLVEAAGYEDYQRAMEAKLLKELVQQIADRPDDPSSTDAAG